MINGDINKIDLGISDFKRIIEEGNLYIDKTRMIENFLNESSLVNLIARQRRIGKSLNMDMLKCFLTDKEDLRYLFKGLYIESSNVWNKANSAPVFYFDFKRCNSSNYKVTIHDTICDYIESYCDGIKLSRASRRYLESDDIDETGGLYFLTESVYRATGKRSYILIDEYDKLLMDNYNTDRYEEIRKFEASLLTTGLKGNNYLERALLTGVMRVSHESILSGLNNIVTFDVFNDTIYTNDYGLSDEEITALSELSGFDIDEMRSWYNGIKIKDYPIYNIYSVMSYLNQKSYECFWGKSGTLEIITSLINDEQKLVMTELLNGEKVKISISSRFSLKQLLGKPGNKAFYSLLVQAGYLAIEEFDPINDTAYASIPNQELMAVWKNFIFENLYSSSFRVKALFDNVNNLNTFSADLEYFLCDRLSYHDLADPSNS